MYGVIIQPIINDTTPANVERYGEVINMDTAFNEGFTRDFCDGQTSPVPPQWADDQAGMLYTYSEGAAREFSDTLRNDLAARVASGNLVPSVTPSWASWGKNLPTQFATIDEAQAWADSQGIEFQYESDGKLLFDQKLSNLPISDSDALRLVNDYRVAIEQMQSELGFNPTVHDARHRLALRIRQNTRNYIMEYQRSNIALDPSYTYSSSVDNLFLDVTTKIDGGRVPLFVAENHTEAFMHEIAHNVYREKLNDAQRGEWVAWFTSSGADTGVNIVSTYASENASECFAETLVGILKKDRLAVGTNSEGANTIRRILGII